MVAVQPIRRYAPDAALALLVVVLGVLEIVVRRQGAPTLLEVISNRALFVSPADNSSGAQLQALAAAVVITAGAALACALARRHGALALLVVWLTGGAQLLLDGEIMVAQLSVIYVAFALAYWGGTALTIASLVSIPVGALLVTTHVFGRLAHFFSAAGGAVSWSDVITSYLIVTPIVALILGVPWLVGLAVRATRSARASQRARVEAEEEAARSDEIAMLRAEQARLARDVHDVVGHSLAVILAQAESAQFLDPADQQKMQETFANIAATSRRSLSDVRSVLAPAGETAANATPGDADLNDLVEGVRAAGNDVETSVSGIPRPLPPEIHAVTYRTLQEMLTNALKHGRRGGRVSVEQHWGDELLLRVVNPVDVANADPRGEPGLGQAGMLRRLESIGGRLIVEYDGTGSKSRYVAQAWLPVRDVRTP